METSGTVMKTLGAARTLMVQGTTSDAGKSTLVAGLCRLLRRRGIRAAPFKPQNMALNSAVTVDGGEIGRAQALQAQAAGVLPHTDMNPVLLKPASDTGAQIIIHGKALQSMEAVTYHGYKPLAMKAVLESYDRLSSSYEAIVVEGAGSPAEINLRDNDIANMGFAEAVDCPVILIADIDRGGVFAHLVGTLALLSQTEQARVKGFVINRFRGDLSLLQPGLDWLARRTGKPVLGVLPLLANFHLDAEDAIATEQHRGAFKILVPVVPRISNHTDFDALRLHPGVDLQFIAGPCNRPADLIILPGSKNVRDDLAWLRANGWDQTIARHLRYGGKVLGICGGYQMLGRSIADPHGVEGARGSASGFGWLPVTTCLQPAKILRQSQGVLALLGKQTTISGYEIHNGISDWLDPVERPIRFDDGGVDGCLSDDGQVLGTYLHGLFDTPAACSALLAWAGMGQEEAVDMHQVREQGLDRLADTLQAHLDLAALDEIVGAALFAEAQRGCGP